MNDLDSEKIAGNFSSCGMQPADDVTQADIIILNTCSVREKAVQKVYARLGELKRHKAAREDLLVGVVGCMAQLEGAKILKKAPFVNILAGPQKGHVMGQLVELAEISSAPVADMRKDEDPSPLQNPDILRKNKLRASVTISEGCNRKCAFCVVPLTRGAERVRESSGVIQEIEALAASGYVEIMLLGQTVNSYIDPSDCRMTFARLLSRISTIEALRRIRFTSPHPCDFSDELLEVMVSCPKVCNQIHLPVQSGSSRILRSMQRDYTREDYLAITRKIRNASRAIAISTDIIVGFPGETEQDFQDTLSLIDEVQYDSAFSFKYSPRPNTAAMTFAGEIDEAEKSRRLHLVQERLKGIHHARNAAFLGQTVEVLVDGKARSRVRLSGRTSDSRIVNFDGPESLIGQFVEVEIVGCSSNSLKGVWTPSAGSKEAAGPIHEPDGERS
jgi:tRNA-2-methylthio-N6-dimethylallyladenosine synthase